MLTIGLDVHLSRTSVCILDARGNILRQQEVKGGQEAVAQWLAKLEEPFQVCYEASTGYGALYQRLTPLAQRVEVAHPGRLRLIFKSRKKTNRADAQKLASLLHLNQVPAVHVPAQEVRSWRGLIEQRRSLVDQRVSVKNQIRALLRCQGIKGPAGKGQWSQAGVKWLLETPWPTGMEKLRLEVMVEQLADLGRQLARVTRALDERVSGHAGVGLLMTIPGVGPRTAEAFIAYVDDPQRFGSGTIGSYFGLVPREDSTGEHQRLGHITREGSATVRKLLVQSCWRGVSGSRRIQEVYERHVKGDRSRRKLALVATSHWLSRVMLAMLKSGEAFRDAAPAAAAIQ